MPRDPNFKERQKISQNFGENERNITDLKKETRQQRIGGQILHLFQQCLDEATALQLRRENEENPHLTVANFMAIMEKDLGKYFSAKARDEWRQVKLTNWGRILSVKECEPLKSSGRWQQ